MSGNRRRLFFVREHRERAGLTIEQLADKSGWSKTHIAQIESGKRNVTEPLLWDLADALGIEPEDLLDNPADPASPLARWRRVPAHLRGHVLKVMDSFADQPPAFEADNGPPARRKRRRR